MNDNKRITYLTYLRKSIDELDALDSGTQTLLNDLLSEIEKHPIEDQEEAFLSFLTHFIDSAASPGMGFTLAKAIPLTAFGSVGYAYRVAPTAHEALSCIADYHQKVTPLLVYSLSSDLSNTIFSIGFKSPVSELIESTMTSAAISSLISELKLLCGNDDAVEEIVLSRSSENLITQYKIQLGHKPRISDEGNFVRLKTESLRVRNPLGDPETFQQVIEQITLSDSNTPSSQVTKKVADLISASIPNPLNFSDVAKLLKVSERQLRFVLQKKGTSFQEIVRNSKVNYAETLLRNPSLQISQVAFKMGYKDTASFNHSFKRWTGSTPSEFRNNL